jgi:hypothetical protein
MKTTVAGTAFIALALPATVAAMSISSATVGASPDGFAPTAICNGITWPTIPLDCLDGGKNQYVRFIRTDIDAQQMIAKKANRLPVLVAPGDSYLTVQQRGDGISVLTRIRRPNHDNRPSPIGNFYLQPV